MAAVAVESCFAGQAGRGVQQDQAFAVIRNVITCELTRPFAPDQHAIKQIIRNHIARYHDSAGPAGIDPHLVAVDGIIRDDGTLVPDLESAIARSDGVVNNAATGAFDHDAIIIIGMVV